MKEDIQPQLHNRLGRAIAMRAYGAYRALSASEQSAAPGCGGSAPAAPALAPHRYKDPAAPDTFYVAALAAAETNDTMPEKTLLAFADHGKVGGVVPADGGYAERVLDEFKRGGFEPEARAARLQREGVQTFAKSWSRLMTRIREKAFARSSPTAMGGAP